MEDKIIIDEGRYTDGTLRPCGCKKKFEVMIRKHDGEMVALVPTWVSTPPEKWIRINNNNNG